MQTLRVGIEVRDMITLILSTNPTARKKQEEYLVDMKSMELQPTQNDLDNIELDVHQDLMKKTMNY